MKKTAEEVLIEIMACLGPTAEAACKNCNNFSGRGSCCCCYEGAIDEQKAALKAIHKYFGIKKVKKIYKDLDYKF